MVLIHKTICGDHISLCIRSNFRYGLVGIPVEVIPILHIKLALVNCQMLRIKAKLSLQVCFELPIHMEYLLEMSPVRQR